MLTVKAKRGVEKHEVEDDRRKQRLQNKLSRRIRNGAV